jgi:Zn-dependent metalloprotease
MGRNPNVKLLKMGLALSMVGIGLAAMPSLGAQAMPAPTSDPLLTQLRNEADGSVVVNRQAATGKVGFVRTTGDLMPGRSADGRATAAAKADAYLARYASAFGARPSELEQSEIYADRTGWSVTFAQTYRGVPVFAAEVKAHVDREGDLTSVNGFAAPGLSLSVTPGITEAEASARALGAVKAKPAGYEDGLPSASKQGLTVRSADLEIYRMGSPRGIDGDARLAWVVEVWNKSTIRETLILDAASGKPLNRWSMMADALNRDLYEASIDDNGTPDDPDDDEVVYDHVYTEGDAFPGTLDQDQQNEVLGTGEAYWMFRNTFGYNAWDGNGSKMITVNNDPTIDCPNANWNGVTTNYCSGVTGDDTVAHEWAHAYTESTSGLIYQWQAGAMNEAYSDIWGETVDMLNDRMNEVGEENSPGGSVLRTPGTCSDYTRSMTDMTITAPASVAGPCVSVPASFGPVITQTGVDATAVVGTDAANTAGPTTTDGCSPLTNAGAVAGKWVYVDRGTCPFTTKIANAEDAGAIGIVVGNTPSGALGSIAGESDLYGVMVSNEDGAKFKSAGQPVSFHIAAQPSDADPTHRWLSGESDPAMGGAIRDMWNPNCYGDPGKVSDAEYVCDGSQDSGGVHTNSGIVNRTYAILVDGLDGVVDPIGVDKAAWLFWHTQTNYLTPTSYFPDLANGLEASCADLTGIDLEKVTLGDPTEADGSDGGVGDPELVSGGMTAADCAAVADAIAETELRLDPAAECDWQPLLAQGAPALTCGTGTVTKTTYTEDFEDGLAGWTQDEELGTPFSEGVDWEASDAAPAGHAGGVAYGPDPVAGVCGAPGDLTSRNGLISPAITVPAGATPRISFDHYLASEATWDGGNVKVSVNGGAFGLVPATAYLFNAPGGELDPDAGPMGGEAAWTGTDGGQLYGSWGTSVIDLSKVAAAGASVKFRFDMGRDGCNGVDGWYVDNVKVQVCEAVVTPTPTTTPTPTPTGNSETDTKVKIKPRKLHRGDAFKVIVKVTSTAGEVTGKVKVLLDGNKIAKLKLHDGRAVTKVKRLLSLGKHKVVAKYLGSDDFKRSSDDARLRVTP